MTPGKCSRSLPRCATLATVLAMSAFTAVSCVSAVPRFVTAVPQLVTENPSAVDIAQLWQEPLDLASRDLFYGPGGKALAPDAATPFTFVSEDSGGYSPGYDVRDPDGRLWDVKLGPEAQTEVVVSRVLWAVGYHQLPTYYLPSWTMAGTRSGPQQGGRFRPDLADYKAVDTWSWYENEFMAAQPFKGLIVANVLLNNWDWKTSNNRVYHVEAPDRPGTRRLYVVRDLGASLGRTSLSPLLRPFRIEAVKQGSRNDIDGFESQGFIEKVAGDRVSFHYRGIHGPLLNTVSPQDVVWTCTLMSRLSDAQWNDAFRAAGYSSEHSRRYVAKIKSKIAEGLSLARS